MKMLRTRSILLAAAVVVAAAGAPAQTRGDPGKQEYDWHCASCHGVNGKGNGELTRFLVKRPSDLTTLSKRYGGAFPNQLVWEVIDGRTSTEIGPHGAREMPIWGQRFRTEAMSQASSVSEPEWYVRNRIVALLDYLSRIQDK